MEAKVRKSNLHLTEASKGERDKKELLFEELMPETFSRLKRH